MKQIPRPDLNSATVLKPADLNKLHFDPKHTVLTPEQLEALKKSALASDAQ